MKKYKAALSTKGTKIMALMSLPMSPLAHGPPLEQDEQHEPSPERADDGTTT